MSVPEAGPKFDLVTVQQSIDAIREALNRLPEPSGGTPIRRTVAPELRPLITPPVLRQPEAGGDRQAGVASLIVPGDIGRILGRDR